MSAVASHAIGCNPPHMQIGLDYSLYQVWACFHLIQKRGTEAVPLPAALRDES